MIEDTIKELEARIKNASSIPDQKRRELTTLLGKLKSEVVELAKTKGEAAESITGFAKLSGYEATRKVQNKQLLDLSLDGLEKSVKEFEVTHPNLAQIVNSICVTLSKLGI